MLARRCCFTRPTRVVDLADRDDGAAVERDPRGCQENLQRIVDDLQFYADEMEMQRLPARDGANAVRIVAGLIALQRQLT